MPIELRKTGPAITESDVIDFEASIGFALPSDYRKFLLKFNGGRPADHIIRDTARGDVDVKNFFGLRGDEFYDICADRETMKRRIPSRCLSFASDDFGNRFCISLAPPDYGAVYLWDHEEEADDDEEPTEANLYHVADSFANFWERVEAIDSDAYLAEKGLAPTTEDPRPDSAPQSETNGHS